MHSATGPNFQKPDGSQLELGCVPQYLASDCELDLLVHWTPFWRGLFESWRPAIGHCDPPLVGECRSGARHGFGPYASYVLHAALLVAIASVHVPAMRGPAYVPVEDSYTSKYEVIYYSRNELPQMIDAGGAPAGKSGKAGGRELYHPTQTIRISRGPRLVDTVVDVPPNVLPPTKVAANLLMPAAAAPAPPLAAVARTVVPNIAAVQPIAPAPSTSALSRPALPNLAGVNPVAPAPFVERDRLPNISVPLPVPVQPAPNTDQLARLRVPETMIHPVPPPVSVPATSNAQHAKLTLPAGIAIQPPPENVTRDLAFDPGVIDGIRKGIIPANVSVVNIGTIAGRNAGGTTGSPRGQRGTDTSQSAGVPGGSGVVISANPGSAVGAPTGNAGSLAMSPAGGKQSGMGGAGGGNGVSRGSGPGSGTTGSGPGAASSGAGVGKGSPNPGITLASGPGGSGGGAGAKGGIPGLTVSGGQVFIPSFGTSDAPAPGSARMPSGEGRTSAVTIIATSRSGGAVNAYGHLKGAQVYTIYLETNAGTAFVQFAERAGSQSGIPSELTPPEAMLTNMPKEFRGAKVLVSCILDREGRLKNIRFMEAANQALMESISAALAKWRFRPVFRANEAIEVDAIIGLNVDTQR